MRPPNKRDAAMLAKGLITPTRAADITGLHYSTLCRWMDEGQVAGQYEGQRRYLQVESLIEHVPAHAGELRAEVQTQAQAGAAHE